MNYRGYEIYVCIATYERWELDSDGEPTDYFEECRHHAGSEPVYEVVNSGGQVVHTVGSIAGAKWYIDNHQEAAV